MNFTREPIIETIISAKEGYKLSIKSSKGVGGEEYLVDAVEVVSFGGSFFYRSGERPKAFFLPANDYEILEVRETRLLIKQPSIEKSIKIGGGKKQEEVKAEAPQEGEESIIAAPEEAPKTEQKRDRRKHRRGRRGGEEKPLPARPQPEEPIEAAEQPTTPPPPSAFSHLLQPPEGLISDTLKKYKRSEELPTAPGIVEELASHIEHSVGEGIVSAPFGPESPSADPELISERPTKNEFHEPLYSAIDETELPPGIE